MADIQDDNQTIGLNRPAKEIREKVPSFSKTSPLMEKEKSVEATIKSSHLAKEEEETKKRAALLRLPYVNLSGFPINSEVLFLLSLEQAEKFSSVPYLKIGTTLRLATTNPPSPKREKEIKKIIKKLNLKFVLCSESSLNYGLSLYKTTLKPFKKKEAAEVRVSEKEKKIFAKGISSLKDVKKNIKKVSTTKMLELLLAGAGATDASDIHIVPLKTGARLRYRIDGVLHDAAEISNSAYKQLNSRIKFLAKLKIDVKNLPQDGRFSVTIEDKWVDLRVSTLPTLYGESIVMRLLEQEKEIITLEKLGFNKRVLTLIKEAIKKPTGLVLNTGPTGSGKTTTLYAILQKLNRPEVKIITLEDPVEYKIAGISQTPIDPFHDFGFAKALRSTLRQDPDIIMVGEIRDADTATISLHAALTGHLVLTTLHTNNAPSALVRLTDMKVRPFLLVGSINLSLAQRLVRKICQNCKKEYRPQRREKEILKRYPSKKKASKLYQGEGCEKCNFTGYKGRVPIAEAFVPDEKIEDLILSQATQKEITKIAKKEGMQTMFEDGIDKVKAGITTLSEILRVTSEY